MAKFAIPLKQMEDEVEALATIHKIEERRRKAKEPREIWWPGLLIFAPGAIAFSGYVVWDMLYTCFILITNFIF